MSEVLLTEKRGAVFVMTMNRPEARNALSRELMYLM
ncbi:MAG: enoyl-CoA hydratase, partial [Actinomycetota bacterium]|nr:enoyl-CoA hydratase [Actinomycetota bacterium]